MFSVLRAWSLRVAVAGFLLWVLLDSGALSMVLGYAGLVWVLFRAFPGCVADLRTVRAVVGPWLGARTRVKLSDPNSGF